MMRSRRRSTPTILFSALVFALTAWGHPDAAHALVTDFTWNPTSPVMGELVTYSAVNDLQNPIKSYKWEYKFSECGGWTTAASTGSAVSFYETRPGTWQVRLTVTYMGHSGNPVPPPPR